MFGNSEEVMREIQRVSNMVSDLRDSWDAIHGDDLIAERNDLLEEIEKLKIERDRKDEENARKIRDVEHKTGLLKKQVEWEQKKAVEEAKLEVQKANLDADRKRFEEQMDFHRSQIKNEIDRFESLLAKLMERLPVVKVMGVSNGG